MERPDLRVEYKLGDETKTVRWTYGLSNDVQRLIPTIEECLSSYIHRPEIRDYVLRRSLTEKKGFVKSEDDLIDPELIDEIEPDEVLKILEWVQAHLMYFFGNSAEFTHLRAQEFKETLDRLSPSIGGSLDSASTTPSVGASESSKES